MQVPEHLRNYIDYEAYGRDVALEEGGEFTDLGYVRDTGSSFHEYQDLQGLCPSLQAELPGSPHRLSPLPVRTLEKVWG